MAASDFIVNGGDFYTAFADATDRTVIGVDLDAMAPKPNVAGKGSHGGYCGPAVKPIALNMVAEIARDQTGKPISFSVFASRQPASITRPRTPSVIGR